VDDRDFSAGPEAGPSSDETSTFEGTKGREGPSAGPDGIEGGEGKESPSTPDPGPGQAGSGPTVEEDAWSPAPDPEPAGSEQAEDAPSLEPEIGERDRICASKHREIQVTRAGGRKLFDKKARKAFLEWFAATGNVLWSAQKVGFSDKTVWKHRMNDPRFAEAFDRAFEQSVVRNKARMLERKAKPIALDGGVGEAELEDCDLEKAWPLIVEIERSKARNGGGGPPLGRPRNRGRAPRVASNAEVREALEKRLRAFGRRMRAEGKEPPAWLPPVEPRKSKKKKGGRS
jgi:hypothetical protein